MPYYLKRVHYVHTSSNHKFVSPMLFLLPTRLVLVVLFAVASRVVLNNLPICSVVASNLSLSVVAVSAPFYKETLVSIYLI